MSRRVGRGGAQPAPTWAEVDAILEMTAKALRDRTQAVEDMEAKLVVTSMRLEREMREKGQVAREQASASEDSSFLAGQVHALMAEKAALAGRLQAAERERDHLLAEVQLLRGLLDAHNEESPHEPAGSLRLYEELLWERQRTADLEREAAALRARVAALERTSQAHHLALLEELKTCMQGVDGLEQEQQKLNHEVKTENGEEESAKGSGRHSVSGSTPTRSQSVDRARHRGSPSCASEGACDGCSDLDLGLSE